MNENRSPEEILLSFIEKEFLFGRKPEHFDSTTPLFESGIVDSVGILRLIAFVESRFGVRIGREDLVLRNFATIDAIAALLRNRE